MVGIIDIGTRGSRLLYADIEMFKRHGFNFSYCRNMGEKTFIGNAIIERNGREYVDDGRGASDPLKNPMKNLEPTIAFMNKAKDLCRREGINLESITAVGTEVFRRMENRSDVINHIENKTKIRIKVLDPLEEAECTFYATKNGCNQYLIPEENFIVIEQGGGSLQLTIGKKGTDDKWVKHYQTSIPELGTLLMRKNLFQKQKTAEKTLTLKKTFDDFKKEAGELITEKLKSFQVPGSGEPTRIFALGSVITNQCGGKPAREYHGRKFTMEDLEQKTNGSPFMARYGTHGLIKLMNDSQDSSSNIKESWKEVQDTLEDIFGLACYIHVMKYFNADFLRVSSVALRYGVFFRIADGNWTNIREWQGRPEV